MKQLDQKLAYVLLLGAMLVNPHPVAAAVDTRIPGYAESFMTSGKLEDAEDTDFDGALVPAEQKDARYTTSRLVTAYTSTVDQCDDTPFITANGTYVHDGVIAANWLKFGAKVRIPSMFGDKVFTVADRMHPRFDDRMDIWFADYDEAVKFGIRRLTVEVL
jgi:3D (Asp-Asp-Asp) domain-containing protein